MKQIITLLAFLISINLSARHSGDSLSFKLNQYFTALTRLNNFNGNVIIAREGKILLNETYNINDTTKNLNVIADSKFIIASVSKVFIKLSILKLAEQHKLSLDDALSKFIPDFPAGNKITVEQLMYHRSGLPRELTDFDTYDTLTLEKVVELSKKETLQFEPNTKTLYSNVGYFILHYIIKAASKEGYPLYTQHLIQNMGLNNTGEYTAKNKLKNFVWGFNVEQGKIIPTPGKSIDRFETGNYYSTISDLYKFSEHLLAGKVIKKSSALKMFNKDSVLVQAGGRPGYRAYFYKNLNSKVTFIFLSNFTDIPIQEVTADIISIMDHKPYEIPHAINRINVTLPEEVLKRYTGKYALDADYTKVFTIRLENGKLYAAENDEEKTELNPDTETTFFDDPHSKDGYIFTLNHETGKYDLTIISTGLKLTTKRLPS